MKADLALTGAQVKAQCDESARGLRDIIGERVKNRARWGVQDHPSVHGVPHGMPNTFIYDIPSEQTTKNRCHGKARRGTLTWADILLEEFAEAVDAPNEVARHAELVQVAAVALAWIECIDRRRAADLAADASFRQAGDPRCTPAQDDAEVQP